MIILSHWYIFLVPGIIFIRRQSFSSLNSLFEKLFPYQNEPPRAFFSSFFYEEECRSTKVILYEQCRVHKKTGIRYVKRKDRSFVSSDGTLHLKNVWYPEELLQKKRLSKH